MENHTSQPTFVNGKLFEALDQLNDIVFHQNDRRLALQKAAEIARETLGYGICTIVLTNNSSDEIEHVACAGCSSDFLAYLLGRRTIFGKTGGGATVDWGLVRAGQVVERYGLQQDGQGVARPEIARKYGLQSLLSFPLNLKRGLIGYLNFFTSTSEPFPKDIKQTLHILANHVSIMIERLESLSSRRQLQKMNEVMREMAEARDVTSLLDLILISGSELVGASRGAISRLNLSNGELNIEQFIGPDLPIHTLRPGQGITNEAMKINRPVLVNDVRDEPWRSLYIDLWADTRSELAVPIVLNNAAVRKGTTVERAIKPIGVLNLESPKIAAFSEEDGNLLWSLASYGGVLIEGLETDEKVARVAKVQQTILEKTDWDGTMNVVLESIKGTLGYDYVNISVVKLDTGRIKTEYLIGILEGDVDEFMRLADHPLRSDDIQASIAETKQIEVPSQDDPRFDPVVYKRFGHDRMIRVFVPMIAPSDNRVMGTVETGYQRSDHRTYIYEQDVQILKGFIDYAARALDRRQSWVLEKIGHEFRAPVVGIRNNASFLQRRYTELGPQKINLKCEDILTDCEILLSQIAQLEHTLGKPLPPAKIVKVLVFRDIIIKTIRQLGSLVQGQGFDVRHVEYSDEDMYKIKPIWVDKSRLSQVFFNLIINSIKYSEGDPSAFRICVNVDETREAWLVKVQDWGIGVRPEYAEKIFDEGYRTPEAMDRNVTGSGLGLTIARQYMRMIGGDVKLASFKDPTEFEVILPKNLMNKPEDTHHDSSH